MPGRSIIDYTLARRAVLADLASGRIGTADVCDAQQYLIRAARHYGSPTPTPCPVCRKEPVRRVCYAYGDALGSSAGQARFAAELTELADEYGEITVYEVDVCPVCRWNHLATSYQLGTARARRPSRRRVAQD